MMWPALAYNPCSNGPYGEQQMKILVRNLSRETTQAELLALFREHGNVQYCKLVLDAKTGESKGFGFVEMPKAGEAKAAIKALNARELRGSRIRVKRAEPTGPGGAGSAP
jgi:RNA recognition motif-containing protein